MSRFFLRGGFLGCTLVFAIMAGAQEQGPVPSSIEVAPSELELRVGDSARLQVTVRDAAGNVLDVPVVFLPVYGQFWNLEQRTWGFNLFDVGADGLVTASRPGSYAVRVRAAARSAAGSTDAEFLQVDVPLTIVHPAISTVDFVAAPTRFFEGTTVRLQTRLTDAGGAERRDVAVRFASGNTAVVRVNDFGDLMLVGQGSAEIEARAENASASLRVVVEPNPAVGLELTGPDGPAGTIRTGDVVHFAARPLDAAGNAVVGLPVTYSFLSRSDPMASGGPSSGLIAPDGRFVADLPGEYTIVATSGSLSAMHTLRVVPRDLGKRIELVGHGRVQDRGTSDLWVWEAPDGRDYAITGTHSAEGHAYVWDVTDPGNLVMIDSIHVDARTVNDVKVSEDGRIAVMSREGASNRRNGIVILDVSDPLNGARILATFDDELTGGVHNTFIYDSHVYALSAGQRFDVINIEDPTNPHRVGRFQLPNADRSIHDVWVADGIAYTSNWNDGVVMVDVGGGSAGGSPANPVLMGRFAFPTGWNHAAYPYRSRSADKFYVFAGDEAARTGPFSPRPEAGSGTPGYAGEPDRWRGWIHILDWSGEAPELVGRYEVPEAGSHNIWVEDDIMYAAFYNGGLRVVDVSGELMGDLYRQGREIAYFLPFDPEGFQANSPQVWGAQPHKGTIFFTDYNSGLWAVRISDGGR